MEPGAEIARMAKKTDEERWHDFRQEIMDQLDVKAECESWGIVFTGKITSKGWAECHAVGREDNHPSAAVNLSNGQYNDLGGGGSKPFFHLAAYCGAHPSYMAAVEHYARKLKMKSRMPSSKRGAGFWSSLRFSKKWNPLIVRGIRKELDLREQTLIDTGAVLAGNSSGEMCVCFPVYHPEDLFGGDQVGFVTRNAYGGLVTVSSGPGIPAEKVTNKSLGLAGMINKLAFDNWESAEVVYKTEGISDMLKLQELVPEEFRSTHVVTTNSDGADASATPWRFSPNLNGKHVVICHDADVPGQFGSGKDRDGGAKRWVSAALSGGALDVVNLQLPYRVEEKKGKDVRDWIIGGGSWEGFQLLIRNSEKLTREQLAPEDDLSDLLPHQQLLKMLDLIVLGHSRSGTVTVFNAATMRQFKIRDIDRFSYNKMLIHIGKRAVEKIHSSIDGECPPDRVSDIDVRRAISEEAGGKEITRQSTVGIGFWKFGSRMVLIGSGEWLEMNGGGLKAYQKPTVEDRIVDFGECEEIWYDRKLLTDFVYRAREPEWRAEVVEHLEEIVGRWQNHRHPMAEMVLSGLILGSWMQQAWKIRPWVGITGESSAGKTVLFGFLTDFFGNLQVSSIDASAAGIRARMGCSSRIVLLDEFERCQERPKILAMFMGATRSGELSKSLRSNTAQESISNALQIMPWLSAIEHKADTQAERNRYIRMEMESREGMDQFDLPDPEEIHHLRNQTIAIILCVWERALEIAAMLTRSLGGEYSRVGESYTVPCAAYSAALGHTDNQASDLFYGLLQAVSEDVRESRESEQEMLLEAILKSRIPVGAGQQMQISELLARDDERSESDTNDHLERTGLKKIREDSLYRTEWTEQAKRDRFSQMHVFVDTSKNGPVRRGLLRDTDYAKMNISAILARVRGSFRGRQYLGGNRVRGVYVPVDVQEYSKSESAWPPAEVDGDLIGV
jgi:hypothetical protein